MRESAYYMRIAVELPPDVTRSELESQFTVLAEKLELTWSVYYNGDQQNVAVLVSKTSHCFYDLLMRSEEGSLGGKVVVAVGNHPDLGPVGGTFGVPFYYVPSNPDKSIPENRFREIIAETNTDTVVLARYMQILSEAFTEEFKYRIINIHHGFLPAFKGAKPYHQAWHKGVKIIGATAHFATEDLDQGPIICQDIQRVPETASIDELVELGKDIEKRTLSAALKLWLEHRVFVYAGRTFIL